jgi:nicotinamide phosphoribosyltransferase
MEQVTQELHPLLWLPSETAELTNPERTDGYKPSHWKFLEDDLEEAYLYLESRGGLFGETTFYGAQAHCLKYLCGQMFDERQVKIAAKRYAKYYGSSDVFNERGFLDVVNELGGRAPLEIQAIPEGMTVPVKTPLMTFRNTRGKKYRWFPGYYEGLNFKPWYPTTVCTLSNHIIRMIYKFLVETGTPEEIALKLIDFGYRGVSSEESGQIGGSAHAVNAVGSDTVCCISHILKYYGMGLPEDYMPIGSIQATEHFVMTARGLARENEVVADILRKCPSGAIAIVGDSKNIYDFCEKVIGGVLRDKVRERDGITIVRPDSGDPIPVMMRVMWLLGEQFGFREETNGKPYRTLNKVRVLQGDKNDYDAIYDMCRAFKGARWSIDNVAFGMGGALLQGLTRDTQKFAMKCSSVTVNGKWQDVYKDPITDPGKSSKPGRFLVSRSHDGRFSTTTMQQDVIYTGNLLRPIYREGEMLVLDNFETIRQRAAEWMREAA